MLLHCLALSCAWLFVIPWTVAHQAPESMGFPRQEYWSGLSFPSSRDLPNPGMVPVSPASPALVGTFFITEPLGKHQNYQRIYFHWFKAYSVWSFGMTALGFMAHFYDHRKVWTALWPGEMDSVMLLECIGLYEEDGKTLMQTNLVSIRQLLSTQLWKDLLGRKTAYELFPAFLSIRPSSVFQDPSRQRIGIWELRFSSALAL